jgi:hypothetical protein
MSTPGDSQSSNWQSNPYAPPMAAEPSQFPTGMEGMPQPWEPMELLSAAQKPFMTSWLVLIAIFFVNWVASFLINAIAGFILSDGIGGSVVKVAISFAVIGASEAGILNAYLVAARGGEPSLETYFGGMRRWWPVLAQWFLTLVCVALGLVFFLVPGIILALAFFVAPFYALEGMGPIEAMKASMKATEGQRLKILLLGVMYLLLVVAGAIPCGLGLIVVLPLISLTNALLYIRLSGRAVPALSATAATTAMA